jgi:peptidoglycan/LPS O-acetylase OafA/YrhL
MSGLTPSAETRAAGRFYLLDALRGLAALAVVCFHWQNFFVQGEVDIAGYGGHDLPFYDTLLPLYERGFLAVDLFFSLSGFIFFCFYAAKVSSGRVSGLQFFMLRASRLYPLHLITLLLVALGQALFLSAYGRYMAYWHNDAYHFALNLPLLSSVGLERGLGFNGPAWSISVEAALYLLFFFVCRFGWTRPWVLLALSAFGFFALSSVYAPMGRGVGSFFLGGLIFALYRWMVASESLAMLRTCTIAAAVLLWLATLHAYYNGWSLQDIPGLARLQYRFPTMVLFPLTILALALAEAWLAGIGRWFAWLGDISYSSYLWHVPLQLAFALAAAGAGWSLEVFKSGSSLALFMTVLLLLSWASHRYLEMPAQQAWRKAWPGRSPTA